MSLKKLIPSLLVTTLAVGVMAPRAEAQVNLGSGLVITDIDLQDVNFNPITGLLTAAGGTVEGTLAGLPFTTDIENFSIQLVDPTPQTPQGCAILNLDLAPIDIDLLGLHVDTSAICLNITAIPGGGLLGNLLCGLLDDLNLGNLGDILNDLLDLLPDLLSRSLAGAAAAPSAAQQQEPADICDGACEVLDLALGPVDLTLLGLNVHLDNCDDGPVQVCLSATAGEGLLGDLLCGLADGGLLGNLGQLQDILEAINDILDLDLNNGQIRRLVVLISRLLRDGVLSTADLGTLQKTAAQQARAFAR